MQVVVEVELAVEVEVKVKVEVEMEVEAEAEAEVEVKAKAEAEAEVEAAAAAAGAACQVSRIHLSGARRWETRTVAPTGGASTRRQCLGKRAGLGLQGRRASVSSTGCTGCWLGQRRGAQV